MDKARVLELVAESIEVPVADLDSSLDLRAAQWDSLADLIFIGKLDEEFSLSIESDDLQSCRTAQDFVDLVLSR